MKPQPTGSRAVDTGFSRCVQRFVSAAPQVHRISPKPGEYRLRVVALGDDQVESAPSPTLTLEVRQLPPWWLIP